MLTDARLNALAESHYDLEQDRSDKECAQADHRASRLAEIQEPLERRMVRHPTAEELGQAMAAVLNEDLHPMAHAWPGDDDVFGLITRLALTVELRKLADIAAEERLQAEEHAQEGEALRARRVRLGDEL